MLFGIQFDVCMRVGESVWVGGVFGGGRGGCQHSSELWERVYAQLEHIYFARVAGRVQSETVSLRVLMKE